MIHLYLIRLDLPDGTFELLFLSIMGKSSQIRLALMLISHFRYEYDVICCHVTDPIHPHMFASLFVCFYFPFSFSLGHISFQ